MHSKTLLAPLLCLFGSLGCSGATDASLLDGKTETRPEAASAAYWVIARLHDPGFDVSRVGCTKTSCTARVLDLDLSRLDLASEDEAIARARIVDGTAVVFAKLASNDTRDATLVVGNVWLRGPSSPALASWRTQTDQMYRLRDVRETCAAGATCRWVRAEPLDGGPAFVSASLELSLVGGRLGEDAAIALTKGELLARGVRAGDGFMVASVFVPFAPAASDLVPTLH